MRQWYRQFLFGMIGALSLCFALPDPAHAELKPARNVIHLAAGERKPFSSRTSANYGVAPAIVTAAYEAVGVHVEWGFFPWRRAYNLSKVGQWDGSVGWVRTPEREGDFLFSNAVFEETYYVYSLSSSPIQWEKIPDLHGHSFALEYTAAHPALDRSMLYNRIQAYRVAKYKSMLPMVLAGRVDATIMAEGNADYYLRRTPKWRDKIYRDETPLNNVSYHLIISRSYPYSAYMLRLFNEGMSLIKANGTYADILEKWRSGYYD